MRKSIVVASLLALFLLALPAHSGAAAPSTATPGKGTIVFVFKDGHRQTYNLSEIERIDFPAGDQLALLPRIIRPDLDSWVNGRWETERDTVSTSVSTKMAAPSGRWAACAANGSIWMAKPASPGTMARRTRSATSAAGFRSTPIVWESHSPMSRTT